MVVWLGDHASTGPTPGSSTCGKTPTRHASSSFWRALVQIPVMGVCSHLHTTIPELEARVAGRGAIGDYLVETVRG